MTRTNTQPDLFPEASRTAPTRRLPPPTFTPTYYGRDPWEEEMDEAYYWGMTSEDVNPNEGDK